jgi:hypothetical protein
VAEAERRRRNIVLGALAALALGIFIYAQLARARSDDPKALERGDSTMSSDKKTIAALAAAAILALALASCADSQKLAAADSPTGTPSAKATESAAPFSTTYTYKPGTTYSPPAYTPPPSPTPTQSPQKKIGDTVTYKNGLTFKIEHVGEAIAAQYAAPPSVDGKPMQLFKLTVVNGTATQFDPAIFNVQAVYGDESTKAEQVYSSSQGVSGVQLTGLMLPGKTQVVTFALSIAASDIPSLVITVTPDFSYQAIILTGS